MAITETQVEQEWKEHFDMVVRLIESHRDRSGRPYDEGDAAWFAWVRFRRMRLRNPSYDSAVTARAAARYGARDAAGGRRMINSRKPNYVDALDAGAFRRCREKFPVRPDRLCSNSPVTRAAIRERGADPDDPASYRRNLGWSIDEVPEPYRRTAQLIAIGLSNKDVATVLDCTLVTVSNHKRHITESMPFGLVMDSLLLGLEEDPDVLEFENAE